MEAPALPVLRPLRLGELLDQAVRMYRRNFLTFVGIIALVYIPFALLQILFSFLSLASAQQARTNPQGLFLNPLYWLSLAGSMAAGLIYLVFVNGVGTAALTQAISSSYLGRKTSILEAYQQLGTSWVTLLMALVLFVLIVLAAFIWFLVPCVGTFTGLGLLVFLAYVVLPLIAPIVVIEKADWITSLARAWELARRRFWWLLGFAIIFYLFNLLVVVGPTVLISYLIGIVTGQGAAQGNLSTVPTMISSVAGTFLQLLILPIQMTAWTLVYFDLRVRTEGFDLALLTANTSEGSQADISRLPTAAPTQQWLTADDVGKFVIITIVGAGFYGLFVLSLLLLGVGAALLGSGL